MMIRCSTFISTKEYSLLSQRKGREKSHSLFLFSFSYGIEKESAWSDLLRNRTLLCSRYPKKLLFSLSVHLYGGQKERNSYFLIILPLKRRKPTGRIFAIKSCIFLRAN